MLALLGLGGAGVSEVATSDLLAELVLGEEVLGKAESLVQAQLQLAALRDGCPIGLDGAVPPWQERTDALGRRRWWEAGKSRLKPLHASMDATLELSGCQCQGRACL